MLDVTDANFQSEVIEKSMSVPVVVDLWAPWCGPCKTLGPTIEKVVAETEGRVVLAKVNVDENPMVSSAFKVQSIPAVFALKDGKVIDSFVGALPESGVREFVNRLAPVASPVDILVEIGDEESLKEALELEPLNPKAITALAALWVAKSRYEDALALLAKIPETSESAKVAAKARLALSGLGGLDPAEAEERLLSLLEKVKGDEVAQKEFLDLLASFQDGDPRVGKYRRMLGSRLF